MEKDDKIIYHCEKNQIERDQKFYDFFKMLDKYDEENTIDPYTKNQYVGYGFTIHKKEKKINYLTTTSKLREMFYYLTFFNPQISAGMEYFVFERRNQFIVEIYINDELISECYIRKLTREGKTMLSNLKGDIKITASPYSQNLKFINFLMKNE